MCIAIKYFIDAHFGKTYFINVHSLVCYIIIIILNKIYLFCMETIFSIGHKFLTDVPVTVNGCLKDNNCPNILHKFLTDVPVTVNGCLKDNN